jgi:hypothetical protein
MAADMWTLGLNDFLKILLPLSKGWTGEKPIRNLQHKFLDQNEIQAVLLGLIKYVSCVDGKWCNALFSEKQNSKEMCESEDGTEKIQQGKVRSIQESKPEL